MWWLKTAKTALLVFLFIAIIYICGGLLMTLLKAFILDVFK